jgi:outer membrane receptor protein involved in Fe transport
LNFENPLEGQSYGLEASVEWTPNKKWRLSGNYSFNTVDLKSKDSAVISAGARPGWVTAKLGNKS